VPKLLIIDDEPLVANALRVGFRSSDIEVRTAESATAGRKAVAELAPDAILLDVGLPDMSGLDAFLQIREHDRRVPVIIITGQATTGTAIEAMKRGAFDFVPKPFTFSQIRDLVLRALEVSRAMRVPVSMPESTVDPPSGSDALIGSSASMQEVYKMIGRVAPLDGIVLVRGESGTGKELVARAIYQHSRRAAAPFLAINCAAIPEALLESELFGHEKGSFTGAERRRIGKFEQCDGGTLFLDEVGDMPLLTQAKVLRVLQDQSFERVGGTETIHTDVRLITATNRPLEAMVASGQFREDLFYRLNVFTISIPPLRDREGDLAQLIRHFLNRFSLEMGREVSEASPETLALLQRYRWPGNLRELQSVLRQSLLHAIGPVLLPEFLPKFIRESVASAPSGEATGSRDAAEWDEFIDERLGAGTGNLYTESFARMERRLITKTLQHTKGNQLRAAEILGITRRSLRNKIRTLGITIERSVGSGAEDQENDDSDDD